MTTSHPHSSEKEREKLGKELETVMERACNNLATGTFADLDNQTVNFPLLFNEVERFIQALLAQSHQSAEAALLEKLRPLLVDEEGPTPTPAFMQIAFSGNDHTKLRNKLRAEIRTALKPPKEENTPSTSVAEVRRVREANEAFYKEHGHYWYEECDNYSIECHAPKEEDK